MLAKIGDKVSRARSILTLEEAAARAAGALRAAPPAAAAPAAAGAAAAPARGACRRAAAPRPPKAARRPLRGLRRRQRRPGGAPSRARTRTSISRVKGTGEKGRITREDVKAALGGRRRRRRGRRRRLPEVPTVDFAKFGPIETKPLSRIKRISGPRLHASWVNIPHVTHNDEADITELEAFRKSLDDAAKADKKAPYRVSLLPLLMKAAVATLKAFPTVQLAR